jgi:hypothetical protein
MALTNFKEKIVGEQKITDEMTMKQRAEVISAVLGDKEVLRIADEVVTRDKKKKLEKIREEAGMQAMEEAVRRDAIDKVE